MNRARRVPQIRLRTPKFKSEAEEAAWWDSHPELIVRAMERAYGKKAVASVLEPGARPKSIRSVSRGLEQSKRGEGQPMRKFLEALAKEHGISLK